MWICTWFLTFGFQVYLSPTFDNPPRPYIKLYTDFTNFTDKLKTEFLISWAAWTVVWWGPQRDCGRAWWGENSRCKTNSISKKIFFLHLRFILTSTNINALSSGWLRNHGLWRILWDDDDLTALARNNSRKEKSISRRRNLNCAGSVSVVGINKISIWPRGIHKTSTIMSAYW